MYFTYDEFIKSATADKQNIDNKPTDIQIINNIHTLMGVMELIRENWTVYCIEQNLKKPQIIITSGYRCKTLNKAVGGTSSSSHMFGTTCDFKSNNGHNRALWNVVVDTLTKYEIPFNQLIDEKNYSWIHLDLMNIIGEQRQEILHLK